jgi:Phosphotransferase enzyme family
MAGWQDRTLLDLMTEHGLELTPEREFPNDGWSGATFTSLEDASGRRFVLKRTSLERDWIARATRDDDLREGWFAAATPAWLPRAVMPYLGAAADGEGVAILSPDLSAELIAWERPGHEPAIDAETLDRVLRAVAGLHALPADVLLRATGGDELDPPWCPLPERLLLLTPRAATRYSSAGNAVGDRFLAGWRAFERRAPGSARELIERLDRDVGPLVTALERLPSVCLHGDLKLANVALLPGDLVTFIDWQMSMRAPVAVEMGWFLVSNSGSLRDVPDEVMRAYHDATTWGRWTSVGAEEGATGPIGDWETQLDLTWIVGLLLRGWRKGLDADAGVTLPSGVTASDDLRWWCERAVEAAERRL